MIRNFLAVLTVLIVSGAAAQNYHAVNGSPYAGSLGVHNNPASILMAPDNWDITLLGAQGKITTNIFTIYNYSYLSNPYRSQYKVDDGGYKRFGYTSANLNILNARIAIGKKSAIAFGANLKSYANIKSSSYNFIDTLKSTGDFFKINDPGNAYSAQFNSSNWVELFATYSRTIIDDWRGRLNAGVTVKVNKGLASGRAELLDAGYQRIGDNRYNIPTGYFGYFYSSNLDPWIDDNGGAKSFSNFMKYTNGGVSFDAGLEYIVNPGEISFYDDPDNFYDYDWKFGASLLDAGFTSYKYGSQSRSASSVRADITNVQLDDTFDSTINSLPAFNDSLATIVTDFSGMSGRYSMINPMRIVLNADHFLGNHFYINAELSLNMPGEWLKKWYSVKEMNLLTVTPRWEKRTLAVYLPVQYTNKGKLLVGAAFKAGPVLLGLHNLANLFVKTSVQNGGGYLAIVIRSQKGHSKKGDRRLDCPTP